MKLWDHQNEAIEMTRNSVRQKKHRPIIAAPTSFGKTVVAAQMLKNCQDAGKTGWFLADRIQLINQTINTFRAFGIDFGVRQSGHDLHNPHATIQIASIQTVQAMVGKHKKSLPPFDMAIVDECHTQYEVINHIIESFNAIPIIGLTATPYSKGLGKKYNNLIVPITPKELLDQGFTSPIRYYGGEHVDLKKIGSAGPNKFNNKDLNKASDEDADRLTGCIVSNWLEWGENSQTIAFSPTQNLSKNLVAKLQQNSISAEHIDCFFSEEERRELYEAHDNGEFKVLSCSRLLNTGYDSPSTVCLIDCFPVKSVTTWVQRVGRIQRKFKGKKYGIYLDHAGNYEKFGPAEDIVPSFLDDGEGSHVESEQIVKSKDKKEAKTQNCPSCNQLMKGLGCKACGYEIPVVEEILDDGTMLQELGGKKANKKDVKEVKEQFYSELMFHAARKGYKDGWAKNQYREKYGVWPNKINVHYVSSVGEMTSNWLKHQRIKWIKSKQKRGAKA